MGFHSWLCKGCEQGIRNLHSGEEPWMFEAVVVATNGDITKGAYDGYGKVGGKKVPNKAEVWHKICWVEADNKRVYSGPSKHDGEQGHFGPPPKRPDFEDAKAS